LIVRLGRAVALVLAAAAVFATQVSAEIPSGPRLAFVRAGDFGSELVTADTSGSDLRVIAGGGEHAQPLPFVFSPPSWSADGARVAFAGLTELEGEPRSDIYLANADGSALVKVPGTREALYPILSPDGKKVAFGRERERIGRAGGRDGLAIWLAEVGGGKPQQLTPWRNGVFRSPSSFSPDGSALALTLDTETRHIAIALSLVGAGREIIARNAGDPIYSPDGTRVAFIALGRTKTVESGHGKTTFTPTELAVANADGSGMKRLTATSGALEIHPSWDPSGRRLAYTQLHLGGGEANALGFGDSLMEVNADGSCRRRILSKRGMILFGATWQPGPGREAGPISC
jgi:Tol biopolymer transport system component